MEDKTIPERKGFHGFVCYSGKDITPNMLKQCFEIDKDFFQEKYFYNQAKVEQWLKKYNDMCSVLYDTKTQKVVAYSFYLFISDQTLELFKTNKVSYFTLGEAMLVKPKENDRINLFCLSDACLPNWGLAEMHRVMNEHNVYNLYELAKNRKVKVKNVCIDAVCDYDNILKNQFHIDNFVETQHGSRFYWGKFDPEKIWTYCMYSPSLITEYKKLY